MNEIAERTHKLLDIVSNYNPTEMKKVFAQLSALKTALEEADLFYEASVQFAQLEAYALIRAVELSNGKKPLLSGKNKAERALAAVWLYKMTEKERRETIEKCQDGKTIVAIYKEQHWKSKDERVADTKKFITERLLEDLNEDGVCQINQYDKYLNSLDSAIRQDIKDGFRNMLLQKGAVGIKDNNGTYINPQDDKPKIYDALEIRINSICSDYLSFISLASKCTAKPVFKIGRGNSYINIGDLLLLLAAHSGSIIVNFTPCGRKQMINLLDTLKGECNT